MLLPQDPQGPDPTITSRAQAVGLSYPQIIDTYLTGYSSRPALAERAYTIQLDPRSGESQRQVLPQYRAMSYSTLRERVMALAAAWRSDPEFAIHPGERVCAIGFASIDFAVLDLALAYSAALPVPLSTHLEPEQLEGILQTTEPAVLAVTLAHLPAAVEVVGRHACIRGLLVFDGDMAVPSERRRFEDSVAELHSRGSGLPVCTLQDLIGRWQGHQVDLAETADSGPGETALLIHTSGSTGPPKGACIPFKALMHTWRTVCGPFPKVVVVLAPFHHMMGRDAMASALSAGGTAYFTARPDLATVFEDIRLARPTSLTVFPRLCEAIHQQLQAPAAPQHLLGDRLQSIVVASAPIAPAIRTSIAEALQIPVHEGYSSTETASGGLAMNGRLNRNTVTEYRLRSVLESGYSVRDQPYPRGELCVRTRYGISGYFRNPKATAQLFDTDGFCCTGDIVEERGPDQIVLIDRRSNAIKLSQGEFVAVGQLEQRLAGASACLRQVHVHGDSRRSYLLAVVVPEPEVLDRLSRSQGDPVEPAVLVRGEILRAAAELGLRSFEIPRDVILADEPFSVENGLLSPLGKPLRPAIRRRYLDALEALYRRHEASRASERQSLRRAPAEGSIESRLRILVSASLGVPCPESELGRSFRELGGDSLGAVQLSAEIEEVFGVSIGAERILAPGGTIHDWARRIRLAVANPYLPQPASEAAGGRLMAADLQVDRFIDRVALDAARTLPESQGPPQTVLLTGATGFLGGRLLLAWLERLASSGGRLLVLVRPSADIPPLERLEARFAHLDPMTAARWRSLADGCLEVVTGDLEEPRFGLDVAAYSRLVAEVDAICHCGALVNHRLAYRHLHAPNVQGTVEVLRLAMGGRRKTIDAISSIGVASLPCLAEEGIGLDGSYAQGYLASKWACEQLLRSAQRHTGLPIRVVRLGLLLPDRRIAGEVNREDLLSRLMVSIMMTGIAPRSFMAATAAGPKPGFRITGMPVDVVAAAIVALGDQAPGGEGLFSLGDGSECTVPLDALLDAMEAAGWIRERIMDYHQWLERMAAELRYLPAHRQACSLLDLLEAYRPVAAAELLRVGAGGFRPLAGVSWDGIGGSLAAPAYIRKCLADFSALPMLREEGGGD